MKILYEDNKYGIEKIETLKNYMRLFFFFLIKQKRVSRAPPPKTNYRE